MLNGIAVVQMTSSAQVSKNLEIVQALIQEAAQKGAKLVVLPEMFPSLGEKLKIAEEYGNGPIQHFLSTQAQTNKIWIVAGTMPIKNEHPTKVRATCLVFNSEGKEVARYDKIHLFDVYVNEKEIHQESDVIEAGNKIVVIDTPIGKLGLSVCYDVRFPELYRELLDRGAEIIAIPSAFTVPTGELHWHVLTRARAIENICYVVAACQGGKHDNGRETYGHSLIIDPRGKILSEMDQHNSGVLVENIDLDYLGECRKKMPVEQHRSVAAWVDK